MLEDNAVLGHKFRNVKFSDRGTPRPECWTDLQSLAYNFDLLHGSTPFSLAQNWNKTNKYHKMAKQT